MLVYIIIRERLYIGSEVLSVWKTKELAEKEIEVLKDYYGGQWNDEGVDYWYSDNGTELQIDIKIVRT